MDIKFEYNQNGYNHALQLKKIIRLIDNYHLSEYFEADFLDSIKTSLDNYFSDPGVRQYSTVGENMDITITQAQGFMEKLKDFFGPGRREKILSKQRIELIERAEHAENTAFETLAELADLNKELEAARKCIDELNNKHS